MKLAKKMLASVIALAMIAALSLTAFAAPAITLSADKDAYTVGDTVVVKVGASEIAGLKSGDLVFSYDASVLEYVSDKPLYDSFDLKTSNGNTAGVFRFSFAYLEQADADNDMVEITFKAIAAGDANFTFLQIGSTDENGKEIGSWDGTDVPGTVALSLVVAEPTTAAPEPTTAAPETTTAEEVSEEVEESEVVVVPESTTAPKGHVQTGATGVAAVAGVMALAAVAFVATRKKDEE